MPHLSDLCHTTSKCHQSIFVQVFLDRTMLTLDHSKQQGQMFTIEECPGMNVGTGKFSDDVEMTVE